MNEEVSKYMRQLQRKSADSRWSGLSAAERKKKMSELAKARWAKRPKRGKAKSGNGRDERPGPKDA